MEILFLKVTEIIKIDPRKLKHALSSKLYGNNAIKTLSSFPVSIIHMILSLLTVFDSKTTGFGFTVFLPEFHYKHQ